MAKVRLNKFIAECGLASRRKADALINEGKVVVNGKKVFELGTQVDPSKDKVIVDGHPIELEAEKVYLMLFKPKGVLPTLQDEEGRPCLGDYVEDIPYRIFPVDALDWGSEGLVLLTNDGTFSDQLIRPKEKIHRIYDIKIKGELSDSDVNKILSGVPIPGGRMRVESIERLRRGDSESKSWFRIEIYDQNVKDIRAMFFKVGADVEKLQRIKIGQLELKGVVRGEYINLTRKMAEKVFWPKPTEATREKRKVSVKRQPFKPSAKKPGFKKRVGRAPYKQDR